MKNGPNWVVVVVVGAALLAPLLDEAIALRFIADFFALGLGMALAVGAARTLRGTSSQTAQQDPPVEIATLTPGLPGVIAGKVITPAEEPSRLTDDVFVAVLGSVVRVEGNVGAQHTPIRTRLRGETLEVRDASGVAEVALEHMRLYGTLHRSLEWSGDGLDAVPNDEVREMFEGRSDLLQRPSRQVRHNRIPHFRYTEIVIREGDEVVVTGDVEALTEEVGEAKGYRENATEHRARLRGSKGSPVLVRSVSLAVVAAQRQRAVRAIGVALALGTWAVVVWFLPSLL